MTTGQHLVALSGLPSASALAHLLGIQTGSGTGETVLVNKINVITASETIFCIEKSAEQGASGSVRSGLRIADAVEYDESYVHTAQVRIVTKSTRGETYLLQRNSQAKVFALKGLEAVLTHNKE